MLRRERQKRKKYPRQQSTTRNGKRSGKRKERKERQKAFLRCQRNDFLWHSKNNESSSSLFAGAPSHSSEENLLWKIKEKPAETAHFSCLLKKVLLIFRLTPASNLFSLLPASAPRNEKTNLVALSCRSKNCMELCVLSKRVSCYFYGHDVAAPNPKNIFFVSSPLALKL